jgi:hypothetical protein
MKKIPMFKRILISSLVSCLAACLSLQAESVVSERLPKAEEDLSSYNIKFGDVFVDAAYKMTLGHDDNSTASSITRSREEGVYIINGMQLGFYAPINEDFAIDADAFIGYKAWTSGNNNDGMVVDFGSGDTLGFDWRVNEGTTLSIVDRLKIGVKEIEESAEDEGSNEQYLLKNDIGLQFFQQLSENNSYGLKIGMHTVKSLNDDFEERERNDQYFGLEFNQQVGRKLIVSPYAVVREYDFDQDINNDADEWQAGLGFTYLVSETLQAKLVLGWQDLEFDGNTEEDDDSGLEGSFNLQHQLSENIDHSFFVRYNRRVSKSSDVNFSKDWLINYQLGMAVNSKLIISPHVAWFISEDEKPNGEKYDLFVPGININYALSEKMVVDFNYKYTDKSSNTNGEYDRKEVFVSLTYDF